MVEMRVCVRGGGSLLRMLIVPTAETKICYIAKTKTKFKINIRLDFIFDNYPNFRKKTIITWFDFL